MIPIFHFKKNRCVANPRYSPPYTQSSAMNKRMTSRLRLAVLDYDANSPSKSSTMTKRITSRWRQIALNREDWHVDMSEIVSIDEKAISPEQSVSSETLDDENYDEAFQAFEYIPLESLNLAL